MCVADDSRLSEHAWSTGHGTQSDSHRFLEVRNDTDQTTVHKHMCLAVLLFNILCLSSGHSGSISQVCVGQNGMVAASASYDKTVRLWSTSGKCQGCLKGHTAPILELEADNSGRIISGDRSGCVRQWDTVTGACTWELKNVHKGHITALAWADASGGNSAWFGCFCTGGQDGCLRIWDPRAQDHIAKLALHTNKAGKGAVSAIIAGMCRSEMPLPVLRVLRACKNVTFLTRHNCSGGAASAYMAATCGADHTMRILDSRANTGIGELARVDLSHYPYSFTAAGGLLIAGCSNGVVQVVDAHVLQTQYSLGVSDSAIRCLQVHKDKLVCAGDTGRVVFYSFHDV